ncbi:MAG TPA: O-succinylbenzoate synthase [Actinobacteria bacterium]|jgi:O-succinylbenzoate synthase|nr:O-succinylbenzoate synthase [Actinomycetota bacterium]
MAAGPSLDDLLATAVPFALPLRHPFRGLRVREGVLLEGPEGWGEFAPFDDYPDTAAARWLASAIEAAFRGWPEPCRSDIEVNAIIPAVGADDAARLTREAIADLGCRTIKVKVGSRDLSADEQRVGAIRDVLTAELGPGQGFIRVDANGAWDVRRGEQALRSLAGFGLEYVEQPCATREEMRELRRLVDVRFAADELIRQADGHVTRISEIADVAVLKPAPLGGAAPLLQQAEALDVPVVVSGSLDSSVGLGTALAAAGALPDLPFASGLGTGALFACDLAGPVVPRNGRIRVERIAPDPQALQVAAALVSEERRAFWLQRVADAWAVKG